MNTTIGAQVFPWSQIYQRQGREVAAHLDEVFGFLKECGIESWEPFAPESREEALTMAQKTKAHDLQMPSLYANVSLHHDRWKTDAQQLLQQMQWAKECSDNDSSTRIVVVNPTPISWNNPHDKSDDELKTQAEAMQWLGEMLAVESMKLAYHTHAPEMRNAAREFHHTLLGTDAQFVGLCLDAHWIYRGAGNSQVALYDLVELYGERIVSLHLRQSRDGIWSETLGDGDIDYAPLATRLKELDFSGPIVIEQAIEDGTPHTMPPLDAWKQNAAWTRRAFA